MYLSNAIWDIYECLQVIEDPVLLVSNLIFVGRNDFNLRQQRFHLHPAHVSSIHQRISHFVQQTLQLLILLLFCFDGDVLLSHLAQINYKDVGFVEYFIDKKLDY